MTNCAIVNCKNTSKVVCRVRGQVSYHRFPRDPDTKAKWIDATGNKYWFPTRHSTICSIHFKEEDYYSNSDVSAKKRRLLEKAYPTIQVVKITNREETDADAWHAYSSQQFSPSTSQHFTAATGLPSSPATDDDDDLGDAKLFGDHSDDGSMDSINTSTKTKTSTNTKPTTNTKTQIAIPAANISGDEGFSCNVCCESIVGFRYVCVQCAHYSLCAGCEARGEHGLHYVLRIPKLAPHAEVDAMLSKIRTHLLYGLETEEADHETDDRVVPVLHEEFEIKAEIKEELPDPLEHEDAFEPDDDHHTEPEYIERESTSNEKTLTPAPVKKSSMIITETEGNYVIIENPIKNIKTEPKTTKHKTTEPEHDKSEKRLKMYREELTQAIEALMDTSDDTAGPPTEGASGELPDIVKTEEEDEDAFQVFSNSSHKILEDRPGPDTGMTKSSRRQSQLTRKKKVV